MKTAKPRSGFSLVELLVVVAIITFLAALGAYAVFNASSGQKNQATESSLNKLHSLLAARWSAVIDKAALDARNNNIPSQIMDAAGQDKDRARSIWTYMRLKNEFPTTQEEANRPVAINGYELPPRRAFSQVMELNETPTGQLLESAKCLYVIITQTTTGGIAPDTDGLDGMTGIFKGESQLTQVGISPVQLEAMGPVFLDSWGRPIGFIRMAFSPELSRPPYVRPNAAPGISLDPIDPTNKFQTWGGGVNVFWNEMRRDHVAYGGLPTNYPGNPAERNWVPTLISAGPITDGLPDDWGIEPDGSLSGSILNVVPRSQDNILSFRLRAGQRGD